MIVDDKISPTIIPTASATFNDWVINTKYKVTRPFYFKYYFSCSTNWITEIVGKSSADPWTGRTI